MATTASSLSTLRGDLNATIDSIDTLSARLAPETGTFRTAIERFAVGAEALASSNDGFEQLLPELNRASATLAGLLERNRRSEEHTSELQSLMRITYAVFCLKKKKHNTRMCNENTRPNL